MGFPDHDHDANHRIHPPCTRQTVWAENIQDRNEIVFYLLLLKNAMPVRLSYRLL